MTAETLREAWPMADGHDDETLKLASLLYMMLSNDGWADHFQCGDPDDGMCGKEWVERESVLGMAAHLIESFRPESGDR